MLQQINLYKALPQPKRTLLTLKRVSLWYGVFTLLLALNFAFELWDEHKLKVVNAELNAEMAVTQQKLALIKVKYPMIDTADIENSVKKLQEEFLEKNKILALLSKTRHFSSYLLGIAKAAVDNLWLVNIHIVLSEQSFQLTGFAQDADAIRAFVNKLSLQTEFSGIHFQLENMTEVVVNKETLLSFIISNKVDNTT